MDIRLKATPLLPFARAEVAPATLDEPVESHRHRLGYSIVKAGPNVSPDEVEVTHLSAIEVMILWGDNVLHVSHLSPPRSFYVGEGHGDTPPCDYFLPSEALGAARAPVVVARGARTALVIAARSSGYVEMRGHSPVSLAHLIATGRARRSTEMIDAYEYELPLDSHARIELADSALVFHVSAVYAGKRLPVGLLASSEPASFAYTGLSLLMHVALAAALAFYAPNLRADDSDDIGRDRILMMQKLLNAAADREREERPRQEVTDADAGQNEGGTGVRPKGDEGSMGDPQTRDLGRRYALQGPKDEPDPTLARHAALQQATEFGVIGLISAMAGGDPKAITAPWGREQSAGRDDQNARGNLFASLIGDSAGAGGLGLSGGGEGGGGRGEGIGLQNLGPLGNGGGTGPGQGIGNSRGVLAGGHPVRSPRLREGNPQVNGHLPPEIIQRIVRENFGRLRFCYEEGLRRNPSIQGRVSVRFVIDRSGAVATVADGGSDLPDQSAVQCVVRSFGNLSFPQPEGGMVTVVYPILFHPGD